MKKEYDFSKATKNPYTTALKKSITIRLEQKTIDYFKVLSRELGVPYQSLINMYLSDCAAQHKKLELKWA
jgi:predicted DNA binding CopG/RHH family protein